jgi:VWFA-related protein
MRAKGTIAACMLAWLLAPIGSFGAQQPQPQKVPTYSVESQLVQIFLTVQEGSRRITGLNLSEFSVAEDGKLQPIDHMDSEQVHLQVALLLDCSQSMSESMQETQEAAVLFVESLKPGDRVTLIPFNSNIRAIPQLTDDFEPILRGIRSTRAEYKTKLYDAVLYAMKLLSDKDGRKAIAVFSDGEDTASTASLPLVLNASSRYGYPIYAVCAGSETRNPTYQQVLRQLTETNSGKAYFAENPHQLGSAFLEVSAELRAAYVLYYYTRLPPDDRWHELIVNIANPLYKVYSRRGFFLAKAGSAAAAAKDLEKVPAQGVVDPAAAKESAKAALNEVTAPPGIPRPVDREPADRSDVTVSTSKSKIPTFKVESHLVEVPVFVESTSGKPPPLFAAKDFNIYEDGSRRDITYFKGALNMEDLPKARDLAMKSAGTASSQDKPSLNPSSGDELTLGKYYLVLDDVTTDVTTFPQVKKAAEELVRRYHNPIRPFTVYFTSKGRGSSLPGDIESMVAEIRKANARSNRVVAEREPITAYEAVLIDRGDHETQELGELRTAALLSLRYMNSLGSVEGACDAPPVAVSAPNVRGGTVATCDPQTNAPTIRATLQGKVAELITRNAGYASVALDGLRAVVALAAADKGDYSKTVIFITPGFITGKGSRADVSAPLQSIAAEAQQHHVKIVTVDIGGAASETPVVDPALGALTDAPRLPQIMEAHVTASQFEKSASLDTLSLGSGARRVKADNDIAASVESAFASSGALYYLAFLSRQPADGRYHKIGVFLSSRTVRLHARQGYYARPQTERVSAPASGTSNEEVSAMMARADAAMKNHDYAAAADALEALKWKFQDKPDFWYNLGVAYFNLKDALKATEALQQAWALSPDDRMTGLMLARAFAAAGNDDAAVQTLQTMRLRNPTDLELLIQLGRVYEAASQPAKAYEIYRSALDLSPALPLDFYVVLIRTSALLGRNMEAGIFIDQYRSRGGAEEAIAPWTRLMRRTAK